MAKFFNDAIFFFTNKNLFKWFKAKTNSLKFYIIYFHK